MHCGVLSSSAHILILPAIGNVLSSHLPGVWTSSFTHPRSFSSHLDGHLPEDTPP